MAEYKCKQALTLGGARDEYIDSLKGILIFFVVYGHLLLGNFPAGSVNCALKNFIFIFHMPLFIFLSGMFSHVKVKKKYIKAIALLLETYLIYQLLHYIIPLANNIGSFSLFNYIVYPTWTMWYLVSLISWRIIIYFLGNDILERNKKPIIVLSFAVSLIGGFVPVNSQFSLQRTMCFLPFFILGYYTKPTDIKGYVQRLPKVFAIMTCFVTFFLLYMVVGKDLGFVTAGSSNYYVTTNPFVALIMRVISFVCASIVSISVMRLTPNNKVLADIGKQTLFVYIIHSFVATAIFIAIRHFAPIGSPILLIVLSVCTTYVLALLAKTKLKIMINPLSSIYDVITKYTP